MLLISHNFATLTLSCTFPSYNLRHCKNMSWSLYFKAHVHLQWRSHTVSWKFLPKIEDENCPLLRFKKNFFVVLAPLFPSIVVSFWGFGFGLLRVFLKNFIVHLQEVVSFSISHMPILRRLRTKINTEPDDSFLSESELHFKPNCCQLHWEGEVEVCEERFLRDNERHLKWINRTGAPIPPVFWHEQTL